MILFLNFSIYFSLLGHAKRDFLPSRSIPQFFAFFFTVHNICICVGLSGVLAAFIYNEILFAKYHKEEHEVNYPQAWKLHDAYEKESKKVIYLAVTSTAIFLIGVLYNYKYILYKKRSSGLTEPKCKSKKDLNYREQAAPIAAPIPIPNKPAANELPQES